MSHRIRLGPPWQLTTAAGRTRHARKFGRPRTLDANERVWLVCESIPTSNVFVNGEQIATANAGPFAADITHLLNPRNEVVIETTSPDSLGEVSLEFRQV